MRGEGQEGHRVGILGIVEDDPLELVVIAEGIANELEDNVTKSLSNSEIQESWSFGRTAYICGVNGSDRLVCTYVAVGRGMRGINK